MKYQSVNFQAASCPIVFKKICQRHSFSIDQENWTEMNPEQARQHQNWFEFQEVTDDSVFLLFVVLAYR